MKFGGCEGGCEGAMRVDEDWEDVDDWNRKWMASPAPISSLAAEFAATCLPPPLPSFRSISN